MLTPTEGMRTQMHDEDVHLRIRLGGMTFDYRATVEAAYNFIHDCRRRRECVIELILRSGENGLPKDRLPNESLFVGL
ncbi:hypothetical protein HGA07_18420 [Nocardia veterana]|uniref:Uncharacterized protein n=2 Tax=Nocardia veterana TaxID=132249 RepID=A0A7X6M1H2_9NOCA|nr:hypothetical protein [Nocardia veterana]